MTYNVQDLFLRTAFPIDPEHLATLSDSHWALLAEPDRELKPLSKLKAIAQVIRNEHPDCVCLSEVGGAAALENFNDHFLAGEYLPFITPGSSGRGIENAFLLKRSLPVTATIASHREWPVSFKYLHEEDREAYAVTALIAEHYDLGHPAERRLSRDIPVLHLRDAQGRCFLSVVTVHLKSGYDPLGIDPGGQKQRAAEVEALIGIYAKVRAERGPEHPVVVAGDFNGNASRDETAPEFLPIYAETDLEDALYLAGVPRYERHTHLTFFGRKAAARQLDYVFLSKALHGRVVPAGTYVHRYAEGGGELVEPFSLRDRALLPSDHYPVVCTLEV